MIDESEATDDQVANGVAVEQGQEGFRPLRRAARSRYEERRGDPGLRRAGSVPLMVLDSSAILAILFNLGDCCAYALSRHSGEPLLFKGDDFTRTDVARAP